MSRRLDVSGQSFGSLMAIRPIGREQTFRTGRKGRWIWECRCTCGSIAHIRISDLLNGHTKSCGHRKSKGILDLAGQKFGRLRALAVIGKHKSRNRLWKCMCDCGRMVFKKAVDLKRGHTQSCGCYRIDQLRRAFKARRELNVVQ
jgi:hypothetical protein